MQRMPRRNKPHNNTEIKKGTAICWGFGHCFGHWPIRSALQISLDLPPSRANRTFVFQNGKGKTFPFKQSIPTEGFDPLSVELAL